MADPIVNFGSAGDGKVRVFMHLGEKSRQFDSSDAKAAEQTMSAVLISEFGMPQDEARAFAATTMKTKSTPADMSARIDGLKKDLTDAVCARLKAESDLRLANAEIRELKKASASKPAADTIIEADAQAVAAAPLSPNELMSGNAQTPVVPANLVPSASTSGPVPPISQPPAAPVGDVPSVQG